MIFYFNAFCKLVSTCFVVCSKFVYLQAQAKTRHKVMGVLDIYGFEIFEVRDLADLTIFLFFDEPQGLT